MNRIKVSANFYLDEFVPSAIYQKWGRNALWFIDPRLFELMQEIRRLTGKPITINNWIHGGNFEFRGFRPPEYSGGGKLSQHRFGRAVDFNVAGWTSDEVCRWIVDNYVTLKNYGLSTMEDPSFTQGWTHIDIRNTERDSLYIVKP